MADRKKTHPNSLPAGPRHTYTEAEKKESQAWIKALQDHEATTISIYEIVQRFHADMGKIADLIASGALKIVGFTTSKSILTFPDNLETQDIQERIESIIAGLRVLLVSRKEFQDTLPIDLEILEVLDKCFFDRNKFADAYTKNSTPEEERQHPDDPKHIEEMIRYTQVGVESDDTLKIRFPGESFKSITSNSLGLRSNTKAWRELVGIFSSDPPLFQTGPSYDKQKYDARRKIMQHINNKLIDYFNTHFPMEIPQDFNFFDLDKTEGTGVYRLKLSAWVDQSDVEEFEGMSDDDLIRTLGLLPDKLLTQAGNIEMQDKLRNKFHDALRVAMNRGLLTKEAAKKEIQEFQEMTRGRG